MLGPENDQDERHAAATRAVRLNTSPTRGGIPSSIVHVTEEGALAFPYPGGYEDSNDDGDGAGEEGRLNAKRQVKMSRRTTFIVIKTWTRTLKSFFFSFS